MEPAGAVTPPAAAQQANDEGHPDMTGAAPAHPAPAHPAPAHPASVQARAFDAIRDYAIFSIDDDACIASWSRGAELLTGYTADEVSGKSYSMFGVEYLAGELPHMLAQARDGGCFQQERWWRRRDGGLVWVDELINPVEGGGYVVIARDLTERVVAEERRLAAVEREAAGKGRETALRSELQAAERRAAFLAEASSILVATSLDFDSTLKALVRLAISRLADWCVIHALQPDEQTLTRAEIAHRDPDDEDALAQSLPDVLHGGWEHAIRSVISTGRAEILDRLEQPKAFLGEPAPDDASRYLRDTSIMVTPLMGRGRVLGSITFVAGPDTRDYDEDDLNLAEELGRRAAIALDNARLYREAQEANRAKADFLAVISHELRTPLNAIMGYSDLLDAEISGDLSARQRRQVERIRASARHLLQLIEEILSFARIESGGEEVRTELVSAHELAQEAAAVIEPLAHSRQLDFELDLPGEPVSLETDAGKTRQVLVNLLSNAVKFTERGTVTLRVRPDDERDGVLFQVVDTGIGIAAEQMKRIFDPFWQAERPNVRRAGGTGLGLSVSRRYVRLLGGQLEIDSAPGRGTCVSVRLPRRIAAEGGAD
jgi:PAS domain S-box-containing protein